MPTPEDRQLILINKPKSDTPLLDELKEDWRTQQWGSLLIPGQLVRDNSFNALVPNPAKDFIPVLPINPSSFENYRRYFQADYMDSIYRRLMVPKNVFLGSLYETSPEPLGYTNAQTTTKEHFDLQKMHALVDEMKKKQEQLNAQLGLAILESGFGLLPSPLINDNTIMVSRGIYEATMKLLLERQQNANRKSDRTSPKPGTYSTTQKAEAADGTVGELPKEPKDNGTQLPE